MSIKTSKMQPKLDTHMRFLVRAAGVAFKLVVAAEGLRVAEVPQAAGDGSVL